jgi:hypothetical protein
MYAFVRPRQLPVTGFLYALSQAGCPECVPNLVGPFITTGCYLHDEVHLSDSVNYEILLVPQPPYQSHMNCLMNQHDTPVKRHLMLWTSFLPSSFPQKRDKECCYHTQLQVSTISKERERETTEPADEAVIFQTCTQKVLGSILSYPNLIFPWSS